MARIADRPSTNPQPAIPSSFVFLGRDPAATGDAALTGEVGLDKLIAALGGSDALAAALGPKIAALIGTVAPTPTGGPGLAPKALNGLILGTYVENRSNAGQEFVDWLGTTPPGFFVESHGPGSTWTGADSISGSSGGYGYTLGVNGWLGGSKVQNTQFVMLPKGEAATLAESASGSKDAVYYAAGLAIIDYMTANNPNQTVMYIRPGQEMNGNWNGDQSTVHPDWKWQVVRNGAVDPTLADQYRQTFIRIVTQMKAAAAFRNKPGFFKFIFCANRGSYDWKLCDPDKDYTGTGTKYVDQYGMDGYFANDGLYRENGYELWEAYRSMPFGFQAMKTYADARGTPMGIDEFGVGSVNGQDGSNKQYLVAAAIEWAIANGLKWFSWWDSNGAYASRISDGSLANTASAIRAYFNRTQYSTINTVPLGTNKITVKDLTNAAWSKPAGVTVTPNYAASRDGTMTATRVQMAATNENGLSCVIAHGTPARQSVWVKPLIDCPVQHYSPDRGGMITVLKASDGWKQLVHENNGSGLGFNLYPVQGSPVDLLIDYGSPTISVP